MQSDSPFHLESQTFCHECLAENPPTATHCVDCGAKLHVVGKSFTEELQEKSLVANTNIYGRVSGAIACGIYALFCAALVPQIFANKTVFVVGLAVIFLLARFCGRWLANAINDTSLH